MNNIQNNYEESITIFVYNLDRDQQNDTSYTASAMCVSSVRAIDMGYYIWEGTSSEMQVVKIVNKLVIAHGTAMVGEKIKSVCYDARLDLNASPAGVIRASENNVAISTYPMLLRGSEPCFIYPDGCHSQRVFQAEISLCINTLYDLADVQGLLSFYKEKANTAYDLAMISKFENIAKKTNFHSGQYLPACIQQENGAIFCVVHLKKNIKVHLFKNTRRFIADIYTTAEVSTCQLQGKLFRDVYWGKNREMHCHSDLADILSVQI